MQSSQSDTSPKMVVERPHTVYVDSRVIESDLEVGIFRGARSLHWRSSEIPKFRNMLKQLQIQFFHQVYVNEISLFRSSRSMNLI